MNFFRRLFRTRSRAPEHREGAPEPAPGDVPVAISQLNRPDLFGPPAGDAPVVMVSKGKSLLIMDRLSYEYREGLTQETDPSQVELDRTLAPVSRIRVLAGGMMRENPLGVDVLLDTRDLAEIAAFREALRIQESPESFSHCACLGGPTVECYTGKTVAATLSFHHGHGLRWHRWKHDARFADPERLSQWFNRHGITPDEVPGGPMQLQLLAMGDAERHSHRAQSHLVRGELYQAMDECAIALASDPDCALAYGVRALVYHAEHQPEKCEADCDSAIRLGLNHPEVFFARAVARDAKGDLKAAEADCDAALALAPGHPGYYNSRGFIRTELGKADGALADFAKAIHLAPGWLPPLAYRAGLHEQRGKLALAFEDYSSAIRIIEEGGTNSTWTSWRDGFPPSYYYTRRGWTLFDMGDLHAAESDFDRAIDLDPDDPQALLSRANLAFVTGRVESAIADCTEAIRLRPDLVDGYLARARVWMALDDQDEALNDLKEAIRWSPDHVGAHLLRGQLLLGMAREDDALRNFDAVIRLNPEDAMGYHLRSSCWQRCCDYAHQLEDLEHAVRLAPDSPGICNSLAWLLATCPDPSYRDGRRAVTLGRRALENAPEPMRAEYLDTLAAALAEDGKFGEAIDRQREVLSLIEDIDRHFDYQQRLSLYEDHKPYRQEPTESGA